MSTPRGFLLAAATYVMCVVLGWCVAAVLVAPWLAGRL
jgi:hypothetical protein